MICLIGASNLRSDSRGFFRTERIRALYAKSSDVSDVIGCSETQDEKSPESTTQQPLCSTIGSLQGFRPAGSQSPARFGVSWNCKGHRDAQPHLTSDNLCSVRQPFWKSLTEYFTFNFFLQPILEAKVRGNVGRPCFRKIPTRLPLESGKNYAISRCAYDAWFIS
jgi:hypothetical protein